MALRPYAVARSAGWISLLALLSPLAGLVVEMALAWRFGSGPEVDAFRIASLLLLFSQQLFVLQILPNAVVPVFSEFYSRGEKDLAWQTAFSLANVLLLPAALLALLLMLYPEPVVRLLAPGLVGEARRTASLLIRWFAPACAWMVWSGVATGVLYAHRVFWLPPAVQIIGNVILIAAVLSFGRVSGVAGLIAGVLVATAAGVALYLYRLRTLLRQANVHLKWEIHLSQLGLRKVLRLSSPLLAAVVLSQCTAVLLNRVLSQLPPGTLAQFGYAWKLSQMVSLAPIALATVLFPRFAELSLTTEQRAFRELCTRSLRMALFLALPMAGLVWAVREPLVALLLQRGAFSAPASDSVGGLFGLLLLGAPAAVLTGYLEKISYAVQDMWAPLTGQFLTVLLVALLAPAVAGRFSAPGVMLLCAALMWVAALNTAAWISLKQKTLEIRRVVRFFVSTLLLVIACSWLAGKTAELLGHVSSAAFISNVLVAGSGLLVGGIFFFSLALIARSPEAAQLTQFLQWQGSNFFRRKVGLLGR